MNPSGAGHTRAGPATTPRPPAWRSAPAGSGLPERHGLARLTATVGATATAGSMLVAGAVHVAIGAPVRERLGYTFRGVPARPDVAIGIFAHNLRAMLGVFGLLLVAQITERTAGDPGRAQRATVMAGELILAGVVSANVLVVGAAVGAYGRRMVLATLPHGPIELAAYSLAPGLYLQGRRRALPGAHVAKVAALSVALLAFAAALETFVTV
jgi:Stage II sporulation protein M